MKKIIQKYLEKQCKIDTCLAEKYKDTLIGRKPKGVVNDKK